MPYEVAKDGDAWVCRKRDGKVLGRHKSKAEAEAQLRALYAGEKRAAARKSGDGDLPAEVLVYPGGSVKALDGEGKVGGYLVRWGSPDLPDATKVRDYFTPETDLGRFVAGELAGYFHHALPEVKGRPNPVGDAAIGLGTALPDGEGLFLTAGLDLAVAGIGPIWEELKADDDAYGLSSGAISHLVRRVARPNSSHHLTRWPIVEWSLTPEPGEPRTGVVALKSLIDSYIIEDDPESGESMVEALARAVSALDWACGRRELNAVKVRALDAVAEAAKRYRAGRPDIADLQALAEEVDSLRALLG